MIAERQHEPTWLLVAVIITITIGLVVFILVRERQLRRQADRDIAELARAHREAYEKAFLRSGLSSSRSASLNPHKSEGER